MSWKPCHYLLGTPCMSTVIFESCKRTQPRMTRRNARTIGRTLGPAANAPGCGGEVDHAAAADRDEGLHLRRDPRGFRWRPGREGHLDGLPGFDKEDIPNFWKSGSCSVW